MEICQIGSIAKSSNNGTFSVVRFAWLQRAVGTQLFTLTNINITGHIAFI